MLSIIGAFQGGFFQESTINACEQYPHDLISISLEALSAGTVAARVIYAYELALQNLEGKEPIL